MMTQIKSSKTAALKLSLGLMVTAALLMSFAFDKEQYTIQDNKSVNQPTETVASNQQETKQTKDQVFKVVEQMPQFPGGEYALRTYIVKEIKYPEDAKKAGIQGKVLVNFVIDKDGNVVNPKIVRSVNPSLDKEALRVIGTLPKWTPGKQKGKNVDVSYTVPISFKLK